MKHEGHTILKTALLALLFLSLSCSSTPQEEPPTPEERQAAQLLASDKLPEALKAFSTINHHDQGRPRALVGMALCYAGLGDRARFEMFALEAGQKSPRTIPSWYRLGVMYVQAAERFRERPGAFRYAQLGIEYLRRVFAVRPEYHPDLMPTLGLGLHLAGDDRGAVVVLEDVMRQDPQRADALFTLLLSYRRLNRKDRVRELLAPWMDRPELPPSWRELWRWAGGEVPRRSQ